GLASNPINMYEEVVRTPMIWSWLGQIPIEGRRPEMVNFCDVLPSICEIAGAPAPTGRNLPGRSYAPLLFNRPLPKKQPWRNMVFGQLRNTEMVRDPRFKLVLRDEGASPSELFDLTADPREKVNLYENPQYVTVRDRLTKELENWRKKYA
ncbi:MAG: sulfatase/phosphatase domain-containing protein, partial [Bryobacteraceae bacterium]